MYSFSGKLMTPVKTVFGLILLLAFAISCTDKRKSLEQYEFDETKKLVAFVEDAADLIQVKGIAAFRDFARKNSTWQSGNRYLFAYNLDGTCIFHPVSPELIGRNIINMKDLNGKPVIGEIVQIASNTEHPYGWVHYLWMEPGEIYPEYKSSYIMRVTDPAGHVFAIGSGNYNQKAEKIFVSDMVDSACIQLKRTGLDMIPQFLDKSGKYTFYDSYIFILDEKGTALVDPSFPSLSGRKLVNLKDAIGKPIVLEMIEKLTTKQTAWLSYMSKSPDENKPVKKLAYIRKIYINNKGYIVGSSIRLEKPVWLKI
ncbi:MAG: cache domain-containing protein [Bacteroidota bacterium]